MDKRGIILTIVIFLCLYFVMGLSLKITGHIVSEEVIKETLCGNENINPNEDCDPPGSSICKDNYVLVCNSQCTYDITAECGPTCNGLTFSQQICQNGQCVAKSSKSCEDFDSCTSDSCTNNGCINTKLATCCGDGICSLGELCPKDCSTCMDTDKGKAYNVMGAVTINLISESDACGDSNILFEKFCSISADGSYTIGTEKYICPFGCLNGKCNSPNLLITQTCGDNICGAGDKGLIPGKIQENHITCPQDCSTCNDLDGLDFGKAGSIILNGQTYVDICTSDTLTEMFCEHRADGSYVKGELKKECANGCSGGACKIGSTLRCGDSVCTKDETPQNCVQDCPEKCALKDQALDISVGISDCCSGLKRINTGLNQGYCINCGDNICEKTENNENCPEDCKKISEDFQIEFSNDLSKVDRPPIFSLPSTMTSFRSGEANIGASIDLSDYAKDYENSALTFSITKNKDNSIIACDIINTELICNQPRGSGGVDLEIAVSDGTSTIKRTITLNVQPIKDTNNPPFAIIDAPRVITIDQNVILDASKSWDPDGNLIDNKNSYEWDFIDQQSKTVKFIGNGKILNLSLPFPQKYTIGLKVKDSTGLTSTTNIIIEAVERKTCTKTQTKYFPKDTLCNDDWPSQEGGSININTAGKSCDLFEVCNEKIDPIIADAYDCCDGTPLVLTSEDSAAISACDYAIKFSKGRTKMCQALYLIKGLGDAAVYMQDYFTAEMCCYGVASLCDNPADFYTLNPLPDVRRTLPKDMNCYYNHKWTSELLGMPERESTNGWYKYEDEREHLNNYALVDLPAHVSLDKIYTGTCADYSIALTTLLRKAGFRENEVYTVEGTDHAYNLVKLPGDLKYTFVDTTGNNFPINFGNMPYGYPYCENMRKCYNDNGKQFCPSVVEIYGCINKSEVSEIASLFLQSLEPSNYIGKKIKS
ncbi:hypothetical protein J4468_02570 [Candidatus Woesearchaeota archaeon]|nr:hypothetical protein [Candidatus Woesearchaeota archaeon]